MPRFLKEQKKPLIFGGLLFAQLVLVSIQVPLGEEPSYLEKAVFFVFAPVQRAVHGLFAGAGRIWDRYIYLRRVEAQNQALRDELFHLRQTNMRLTNALAGIQETKEMEVTLAALQKSFLVAAVIGVDASNIYKSIIIDKGSNHGLMSNMPVVDRNGNVVGRVTAPISLQEATVQLLTDDNSAIGVLSETNKVVGQLVGDARGGRCSFKYVLATNELLVEGEELLTSGFDKIFPPGLKAGTILSIATDSSLFKRIVVEPHLNFRELGHVAVITQRIDGTR
jgi:rod shape-determining protein MreC